MSTLIEKAMVRFVKGTPEAFEKLTEKNASTLYFICEPDADRGILYLGDKIIGDGVGSNVDVMTGATSETDGAAGLVPAPEAGEQELFLSGSGKWLDPTEPIKDFFNFEELPDGVESIGDLINSLAEDATKEAIETIIGEVPEDSTVMAEIEKIQDSIDTLNGGPDDEGSIANIAAAEVAKIVADAPEDFDTLKEIADWITSNPDSVPALNSRVTNLEELVGTPASIDPETQIEIPATGILKDILDLKAVDADTRLNSLEALLGEISEEDQIVLQSAIGNLDDLLVFNENDTLVDTVNALAELLSWGQLD